MHRGLMEKSGMGKASKGEPKRDTALVRLIRKSIMRSSVGRE
jgi:hypothetical protein